MKTFNSISALFYREYKILFRSFYDILTIIIFFILGIFIFIFAIGSDKEILEEIGLGIIWTLLLLSTNLSINKFYHNDFGDGSIFLLHINGLSLELIVLIKLIILWTFYQLPFLIIIPCAYLILNIASENMYLVIITFVLGSPILSALSSISGAMNLLNNKNFAIGSIIVMIFSIPVIIFSVAIVNTPPELIKPQISIMIGILFLFIAITPWISSACIRLALRNK